mmetsp:Transcript_16280/g.46893  ORF Transcript_16280/g.46893 Transcript_16280/m.46893 type:complete len:220 (-) Transcript_16280:277-936(-)
MWISRKSPSPPRGTHTGRPTPTSAVGPPTPGVRSSPLPRPHRLACVRPAHRTLSRREDSSKKLPALPSGFPRRPSSRMGSHFRGLRGVTGPRTLGATRSLLLSLGVDQFELDAVRELPSIPLRQVCAVNVFVERRLEVGAKYLELIRRALGHQRLYQRPRRLGGRLGEVDHVVSEGCRRVHLLGHLRRRLGGGLPVLLDLWREGIGHHVDVRHVHDGVC